MWGKGGQLFTAGGSASLCQHYRSWWGDFLKKLEMNVPYEPYDSTIWAIWWIYHMSHVNLPYERPKGCSTLLQRYWFILDHCYSTHSLHEWVIGSQFSSGMQALWGYPCSSRCSQTYVLNGLCGAFVSVFLKRKSAWNWEGKVVGRNQRGKEWDRYLIKTRYTHVWILNKIHTYIYI